MGYGTHTVDEFLAAIASETVAPAGGTAAAVVGATGAALCEMVCMHTVESDERATAGLDDVGDDLRKQREDLLRLADTDARVVDDLFPVSGDGPDGSDVKRSIGVPLTVAEACLTVLDLAVDVAERGNRNAVADAATGAVLAHAALSASVFTVRTNLERVSDPSFVNEVERRAADIERDGDRRREQILRTVERRE